MRPYKTGKPTFFWLACFYKTTNNNLVEDGKPTIPNAIRVNLRALGFELSKAAKHCFTGFFRYDFGCCGFGRIVSYVIRRFRKSECYTLQWEYGGGCRKVRGDPGLADVWGDGISPVRLCLVPHGGMGRELHQRSKP